MTASHPSGRTARRGVVAGVVAAVLVGAVVAAHAAGGVWNVDRVGGPLTADGTVIAVIDSGVDRSHVAFAGRVLPQVDYVDDGRSGDPDGHGTHVAGTAAGGSIDCGSGPAAIGVASTARILPIRVLDADGRGTVDDVTAGIRDAADRGADVINLSLGAEITLLGTGSSFVEAIEYAWSKGSVPVLAAGNAGVLGSLFGSGYGDIPAVVVTATTRADRRASHATAVGSARWALAAPGGDGSRTAEGDVLSAWPDSQCALLAGTSMAAPHVSGALAVLRARGLSPRQAVDRLLATADPVSPASTYGAGIVNLTRATEGLDRGTTSSTTTASTVVAATTPPPRGTPTTVARPPGSSPTTTAPAAPDPTEPAPPDSGSPDAEAPGPGSTTAPVPDRETAAGTSTVRDEGRGQPGAVLVAAAGLSVAALWLLLAGRAAVRLRDRPPGRGGADQP